MADNKKYLDSVGLKEILEALKEYINSQNTSLNNRLIDEINSVGEILSSHVKDYADLKSNVENLDSNVIKNQGINQEIVGDLKIKKDKSDPTNFTGNLYVQGDLIVDGATTTVSHESIAIKDHTFIINSDGDDLSTLDDSLSGLVIRKNQNSAYGIMYDPVGDGVKIGLGNIDESNKKKDFNYDSDQAQFLATRADVITTGNIPEWDSSKKQFIDSGVSVDSILTTQSDSLISIIFDGGSADITLAILDSTELG